MKILHSRELAIKDIKVVTYARFKDSRGYFTEQFRKSDFTDNLEFPVFKDFSILQANESFSNEGTVRGLHFQWNPFMGKLVRTVQGHMIDIVLDIRIGSENFGKAIMFDMPSNPKMEENSWIWVPPGFAHGNFFTEQTIIEYFCTGEYSPGNEAGISPLSDDIDWSLCDQKLYALFMQTIKKPLISEKDLHGLSVSEWKEDSRSQNFIYGKC